MTVAKTDGHGFLQKVTYPYIMAKVRLQARYSDEEDESITAAMESDKETNPAASADLESGAAPRKRKQRYTGSVDVLRKVYNEKGLAGWYQVRAFLFF
jgi:adenine nucleotide transporter 17